MATPPKLERTLSNLQEVWQSRMQNQNPQVKKQSLFQIVTMENSNTLPGTKSEVGSQCMEINSSHFKHQNILQNEKLNPEVKEYVKGLLKPVNDYNRMYNKSDKGRARNRAYYKKHREERLAYSRWYYANNKEKCCQYQKNYRLNKNK